MKRLSPVLVAGILLAFLSFHACGDLVGPDIDPTLSDFSGSCDSEGGKVQRGTVSGTWTRNQSPHRVADTVYVSGELVIEAGALVCLGPDAAISGDAGTGPGPGGIPTVVAAGTAEAPVVFTADRPGGTWGGFVVRTLHVSPAVVDLTHVVIENATTGIDLGYGGTARVTDSIIRRITGPGVHAYAIQLRNVVVDSVCQGGSEPATENVLHSPACAAVLGANHGDVSLKDVWVRDSGGRGVTMNDRGHLSLANVRITGSAGTGLHVFWTPDRSGQVGEIVHPIHITGGRGQPAFLPAGAVPHLLPSLEAQERWTGNAEDVVRVYNMGSLGDLVVGPRLAWELLPQVSIAPGPSVSHLTMLPGARFSGGRVGRFTAEGTPEHPVAMDGTILDGSDAGPSRIVHGRLRNVIIHSGAAHALEMSDVLAENGYVALDAPGSRLERVLVRGVRDPWPDRFNPPVPPFPSGATPTEALRIAAPDVLISNSEVSQSPSDGIRVEVTDGVRIRNSNIEHNIGVGIRNVAADPVDARDNWWGDPDGPLGTEGDGVDGAVAFEPYRTTPMALDAPVPKTVVLTPPTQVVPVGDTVWFTANVLDGAGLPLWGLLLEWRSSDTTMLVVDGAGLAARVTGVTEGTAQVTVVVRSDTALRETGTVQVVAGAPPYQWTRLPMQAWSMWGNPEAGLYAGGHAGIHHYDGAQWVLRWSWEEIGAGQVRSIGGLASDDFWAFGSAAVEGSALFHWDGTTWHQIPAPFGHGARLWVAAPNQVFVVSDGSGPNQGLWYYDGTSFRQLLAEIVGGLWGRSPTDVFVSARGGMLHFDGSTWRDTGVLGSTAYWGTADQIFSVSAWAMFRYDGAVLEQVCSVPYGTLLKGIWGTSPSNIYIVGSGGVVRHYDGSRCWNVWLGTDELFESVWGLGSDIVVGGSGAYLGTPRP
jgi:hypothetical protein